MATTLIKFRRGAGNWWNSTGPSGASNPAGIVGYGTSDSVNYQVNDTTNPTTRTFNQLGITNAEPWVNTVTKQLWIDNVVINPAIKLTLNGAAVSSSMTFDDTSYEAQQVFKIQTTDQYLKTVKTQLMPTTIAGASDVEQFVHDVIGSGSYTATLTGTTWSVTGISDTFTAGANYIGFGWNLSSGVTTPTFLEIPDTNTHWTSSNIIGATGTSYANTTSQLVSGGTESDNIFLNHIESDGGSLSASNVTSNVQLVGSDGLKITAAANGASLTFGHANTAITPGTTSFGLSGNILSVTNLTYDTYGHITGTGTTSVALPECDYTFTPNTAVDSADSSHQAQAVVTDNHTATDIIHGTGSANSTSLTLTAAPSYPMNNTQSLIIKGVVYGISAVSGTSVTLSSNLAESVVSTDDITWIYNKEEVMFKLQQNGINYGNGSTVSNNVTTYDNTKVTFVMASNDAYTASGSDYAKTILMNIDIIDGGGFN